MRPLPRRWRRRAIFAGSIATALVASGVIALNANAAADIEFISGGDFSTGSGSWYGYGGPGGISTATGALCYSPNAGGNPWDAGLGINGLALAQGGEYTLQFDATSTVAYDIKGNVQLDADPYTAAASQTLSVSPTSAHLSTTFTWSADHTAGVAIQIGGAPSAATVCIDNVSLVGPPPSTNLISNSTFDSGTAPWWSTGNTSLSVVNGQMCANIPGGTANPWDVIIGYDNVPVINGENYTFAFKASASSPATIRALAQRNAPPYPTVFDEHPALTASLTPFSYSGTANFDEPAGQVAFQVGGSATPFTLCLDDVQFKTAASAPVYTPDTGSRVRVNQVGYLPNGPKNATVVTDAAAGLPWQLKNSANVVVASGTTTPRGEDATSGQKVHSIDFSSYTGTGTGFTLVADGETSFPFDISGSLYNKLRTDALKFYYTQRSGIEILDSLRPGYARPAGHVGVAPNQGDISVPCQPGVCDYSLNVKGGWYDAGDHGKYVVNGGISVYQLMAEFERTKIASTAKAGTLGDSTLALPESGNGVPDILDEARWELEFLLSMQVPADKPLAGMVHHKIHDANWTGLPLLPSNDPQPRELHAPSTAATLNLAATAAQAARLFAPYDAAFAARCLAAARTAYAAALAHPAIYALPSDGTGGGAYDDNDVSDEFYWAAAELYITTGEKPFADAVVASPHNTDNIFRADGFDWKWVGALGRLDLAFVPNNIPGRAAIRASVLAGADNYLAAQAAHPYAVTYAPTSGLYDWGSNNLILNNMVVLGTAYDLSGTKKYRDGVIQGMDYILGRNALNQSYVTGWGDKASENQHSRWYAASLNPALPHPPVGSLSGGPNSSIQDPKAQALLQGCKPQFCYLDNIDSWSTNEITINWNSPLSWISAFLSDQGDASAPAAASCSVKYENVQLPFGLFAASVTITNKSATTIDGWTLVWAYVGNQKVLVPAGATVTQAGATVTAKNVAANKKIKPNQSATFVLAGSTTGANPTPALFLLNGKACSSS